MSWAVGFDYSWQRDIGYGVPAMCDDEDCTEVIDRGLDYVCGGEPYGGVSGCGLYFCHEHLYHQPLGGRVWTKQRCSRCCDGERSFRPKPDHIRWILHKLNDASWQQWRDENPEEVERLWNSRVRFGLVMQENA